MRWETVENCAFCGSVSAERVEGIGTTSWYEGRDLVLSRCTECNLVWASPRPKREDLYRNYLVGTPSIVELVKKRLRRPNILSIHTRSVKEAVAYARRPVRTVYDIGCGAGTAMMAARHLGLSAAGHDVNKVAVRMLRELGFDARHGFTTELEFTSTFDIVLCMEYLEQSYEPFDDLKAAFKFLSPGGVFYAKTIYLGSPAHRESPQRSGFYGAAHFYYYEPDTLRGMIEAAGFLIVEERWQTNATIIAVRAAT